MKDYKEIHYALRGEKGKVKIRKEIEDKKEIKKICLEDYFEKLLNEINILETEKLDGLLEEEK